MSNVFNGPKVNLEEMLAAREKRAAWQKKILISEDKSLLSATMAIPGPVKTSESLEACFQQIVDEVESVLDAATVVANLLLKEKTGPEYYLLLDMDPVVLKEKMVAIENNHPLGRLVDLDVLYLSGTQIKGLSRSELGFPLRKCFICQEDSKVCGSQRRHSVTEMQEKIIQMIDEKEA